MKEILNLRVRRIEQTISTDDIIPGRYKHMYTDAKELAKHVFENAIPGFAVTLQERDVICCSDTFGIGSSREQAVSSLLAAGVIAVIAPSFGRIFFRNAWNLGLIALEIPSPSFAEKETVNLDLIKGEIAGNSETINFQPPPEKMLEMVEQGGLLAMLEKRLATKPTIILSN
ncbi:MULTISPECIES: LeuD/DmdB family oxidoreductase small subunit [unclassified Halomonas]|uniref:LeuD/DmdB family oxidoreductase small subunit n=1 Tax=unclassified Halomonas TaxID=2609666 RepID=UPI0005FCBA5F|nr:MULTISPECIES: hypothetical protein [unclassified Halomonas]CEP35300.1 Complete genome; segment 7/17 [Halomonas sp. R57-5]